LVPSRPVGGIDGISLSGFSDIGVESLSPISVLCKQISETEGLRLVPKRVPMNSDNVSNLPHAVKGKGQLQFLPSLIKGFSECMDTFIDSRETLVTSALWSAFLKERYRHVVWPTMNYHRLLANSYHPNVLRDAMDREAVFDALWQRSHVRGDLRNEVVPAERSALWNEDVPAFYFRPGRSDLWNSQGQIIKNGEVQLTNLIARDRLLSFDEGTTKRNAWAIRISYESAYAGALGEHGASPVAWRPLTKSVDIERETALTVAREIADHILDLGFRDNGKMFWVDTCRMSSESKVRFFADIVDLDLYSGMAGFLLFFHYASRLLEDSNYHLAAEAITNTLLTAVNRLPTTPTPMGGFRGWSSTLYALTHMFGPQEFTGLVDSIDKLLDQIDQSIEADGMYDIVGGSAGTICVLLSNYALTRNPRCISLAEKCGKKLLDAAIVQQSGIAWKTICDVPLSGFAHGTSGIAYSLFRLAAATRNEEYLVAARKAVEYDRFVYSHDCNNWLDLRPWRVGRDHVAWCHGAPGVGLSLAAQVRLGFADETCHRDLELAFGKTLATTCNSHGICHGLFGNIECLISMAENSGRADWEGRARPIILTALKDIKENGVKYDCNSETLNLMLGLAGIGLVLLRVADRQHVPSFLMLEGPRAV
ncbi:MAG: type 2 lantipeptide synthetase LanM, partial [Nitrososphaerota archaeon]|nr:type 2 lantipeptide synthetase LanM [Nitrososphaerota archaeon]